MAQTVIFSIEVDPALVPDEDLAPLLEALQDFEPVLDEFARTLTAGEKAGFTSQGGAYGAAWASPAASTQRGYERSGGSFLHRSGDLAASIGQSVSLTPDSVQVGIDEGEVPYADYLQSGTGRMPSRLLVAVSDDMIDDMMQALKQYIADATGGNLAGIDIVAEAV